MIYQTLGLWKVNQIRRKNITTNKLSENKSKLKLIKLKKYSRYLRNTEN